MYKKLDGPAQHFPKLYIESTALKLQPALTVLILNTIGER